jgi:hypothetical protein
MKFLILRLKVKKQIERDYLKLRLMNLQLNQVRVLLKKLIKTLTKIRYYHKLMLWVKENLKPHRIILWTQSHKMKGTRLFMILRVENQMMEIILIHLLLIWIRNIMDLIIIELNHMVISLS